MSLFERIQNKRYDLQEKKKKYQKKVEHGFGDDSGKKTGGFEDSTGEGIKKGDYPKTRKELEAKRKFYEIDPKTNQPSKAGVEKYARKHKQLSSGSNIPVELTQADLDKAKRNMVGGEPIYKTDKKGVRQIGTTTGKIGGRVANKRSKNAPSYAEVKAKIDAKNPVIKTPIGPLPKTAKNMKKFPQSTFKNFAGKAVNIVKKDKKAAAVVGGLALLGVAGTKLFGGKKQKAGAGGEISGSRLRDLPTATYMSSKTGKPIKYTYGGSKEKNPYGRIGSLESSKKLAAGIKDKSLYLSKFKTPGKKA